MAASSKKGGSIPHVMPRVKRGKTWRFWVAFIDDTGEGYADNQTIYIGVPRCDLAWQGRITSTGTEGEVLDTTQINYGYAPFEVTRNDVPCTGGTGDGATFALVSELQP